jgi:hypothetical protein
MKEQVRQAVAQPMYNVHDLYHEHGYAQQIARSQIFDNVTLCFIIFNCIWIGIDAEFNKAAILYESEVQFQIVAHLSCLYFTLELLVRFAAFVEKRDALQDYWFVFDLGMVILNIVETWILYFFLALLEQGHTGGLQGSFLRMLRLVRVARLGRLARVMNAIPELVILVKGVIIAGRAVSATFVLLFFIIYVFAIIFQQLAQGSILEDKLFSTVPASMFTLLVHGNFPDLEPAMSTMGAEDSMFVFIFCIFILLTSVTVLNMLTGILVDVIRKVSDLETEKYLASHVSSCLKVIMEMDDGLDSDNDGLISKAEFESLLVKPKAAKLLHQLGVDVFFLVDNASFIFDDVGHEAKLTFPAMMDLVLRLRGSNSATVKDLVEVRRLIVQEMQNTEESIISAIYEMQDSTRENRGNAVPRDSRANKSMYSNWG